MKTLWVKHSIHMFNTGISDKKFLYFSIIKYFVTDNNLFFKTQVLDDLRLSFKRNEKYKSKYNIESICFSLYAINNM